MPIVGSRSRGVDADVMVFIDGGYVREYLDDKLGHHFVDYAKFSKFLATQICAQDRLSGI